MSEIKKFYPTFRYAPQAPDGIKFTDEASFAALGPEWVDSPAKLPPPVEPSAVSEDTPKKGRKAKESA